MVNFFAVLTHNFDVKWPNFMFIENGNGKAANSAISVRTQARSPPKALIHSGFIFLNSLHFFSACSFLVLQRKPLLVGLCVVLRVLFNVFSIFCYSPFGDSNGPQHRETIYYRYFIGVSLPFSAKCLAHFSLKAVSSATLLVYKTQTLHVH